MASVGRGIAIILLAVAVATLAATAAAAPESCSVEPRAPLSAHVPLLQLLQLRGSSRYASCETFDMPVMSLDNTGRQTEHRARRGVEGGVGGKGGVKNVRNGRGRGRRYVYFSKHLLGGGGGGSGGDE